VIVGVITLVQDVATLMDKVHGAGERFAQAGVRKVWVYRALDDGQEVMILQEIENEISARRWIDHPDAAAEWMQLDTGGHDGEDGTGAHPTVFVGTLAHLMTVDERVS
jgi:hypothetical protein